MVIVLASIQGVFELFRAVVATIRASYGFFVKVENAPVSLRSFHRRLEYFHEEFEKLHGTLQQSGTRFSPHHLQDIEDTLVECKQYFEKFKAVSEQQWSVQGGLKTLWLAVDEDTIDRLHRKIDRHELNIILPSLTEMLRNM